MRVDWTYDGCDEHDVPAIDQHWEQVQIELEGKLAELSETASELRIAVERGDSDPYWEIQGALHLPGHTMVASGTSRRPERALDMMLRGLAERIDSVEDMPQPSAGRRVGLNGIVPLLTSYHSQNRSQAFLSFLVPLVHSVGPYVQRELKVRESEGELEGEQISVSDVLDEVLLEAWERFDQWNSDQPLDLWLVQLASNVMDRPNKSDTSIDEPSLAPPRHSLPMEEEAWIEQVSYPETIEISELLPDGPGVETWDDLDLDRKQTHLSELLGKLDRDQRQAFVLNTAHGFNVAEIADFQSRSKTAVENDISQASSALRRWWIDEQTPDREERFERLEMRQRRRRR